MSREVIVTCGKCLLPIHPDEIGLRHFGMYTGHSEHRCIELLRAKLSSALEAQQKAERERDLFTESLAKVYGTMNALLTSAEISWEGESDGLRVEFLGTPQRIEKLIAQRNEARRAMDDATRQNAAQVDRLNTERREARAEVQRLSGQVEEMRHRIRKARQILSTAPYSPEAIDAAMGAPGEGQSQMGRVK